MPVLPFPCTAAPLTAAGINSAVNALGIDAATLWAILHVETKSCGYFASRRPQILFEHRVFSALTHGQWDSVAPDVSNQGTDRSLYGAGGDFQYTRLAKAFSLDGAQLPNPVDTTNLTDTQTAALKSASWGLGQVMGGNAGAVGFASVQDMVSAMAASEDAQLKAVVNFVLKNNLQAALQNQQWAVYA